MSESKIFGRVDGRSDQRCEYLTLVFSPLSVPLRSRWRNNGLSADFLGDYAMTFLPADDRVTSTSTQQSEIRHAVSYIANELLENAMKYHQRNEDIPITINMELAGDCITVNVNNGISAEQAKEYKCFIQSLLANDAGELLIRQLEENAQKDRSESSCLGLLTMITDHGAELGWRFESHAAQPEVLTVTTHAVVPFNQYLGVAE